VYGGLRFPEAQQNFSCVLGRGRGKDGRQISLPGSFRSCGVSEEVMGI